MPQGSDLGGARGVKNFFLKFNQIWCVSDSNEWHMQRLIFWGSWDGAWDGAKGQISLNFNY